MSVIEKMIVWHGVEGAKRKQHLRRHHYTKLYKALPCIPDHISLLHPLLHPCVRLLPLVARHSSCNIINFPI